MTQATEVGLFSLYLNLSDTVLGTSMDEVDRTA